MYVCHFILQWFALFSKRFSVDLKEEYHVFHKGSPSFEHVSLIVSYLVTINDRPAWYVFYLLGLLLSCILSISSEEVTDNVENKHDF